MNGLPVKWWRILWMNENEWNEKVYLFTETLFNKYESLRGGAPRPVFNVYWKLIIYIALYFVKEGGGLLKLNEVC